ncbi:nitronate monooxygenase [Gammaproteobacteria bacterium LSUCC0057]|uniref:Nitronate monooxygenase n=1 Tax=Gammaproteobacteria bacterium LSUCC0057 TaxID=2559237 RepID=A0A4Y8UJC7_9GAMM|nr:nitronate monooxygenase [Gammaproteobacteria bacterium LSUCC0057]
MKTALTTLLGCRYPVIQTAMGWVADANLVAATGNAGGFGFIAGAVMTPAEIEQQIVAVKTASDAPFGVNFHMFVPDAEAIVELCIKYQVAAVSYSRSPVPTLVSRLKAANIVCIPTIGAAKHAAKAVAMGADALVVQGGEGGGHTGGVASTVLLPEVVRSVDVPVAAAGGFKDGDGLVAALAFGASGIAMGTRFLLSQESPVPLATKQCYLNATPEQMVVRTVLDGIPQRMLYNRYLRSLESSSSAGMLLRAVKNGLAFSRMTESSLLAMLKSAWQMSRSGDVTFAQTLMAANAPMMIQQAIVAGQPDRGVLPGGQIAGTIDDLPAVAELIEQIMSQAQQRLRELEALR